MSDSEQESRTSAVGRKRHRPEQEVWQGGNKLQRLETVSTASVTSGRRTSSRESGEISSSVESIKLSRQYNDVQPVFGSPSFAHDASNSDAVSRASVTSTSLSSSSQESGEIRTDDDSDGEDDEEDSEEESEISSNSDAMSSSTPINGHPHTISPGERGVRLRDLSPPDQDDQRRYFQLTSRNSLVYCLCCGLQGHTRHTCPSRVCPHCDERDAHPAPGCPRWRKCGRCRQRGHDARYCRNATSYDLGECDVCGLMGHVEEECVRLWGQPPTLREDGPEGVAIVKNCWSCGGSGVHAHWGDDCPYRDREQRTDSERNLIMLWSDKNVRPLRAVNEDRIGSAHGGLEYGSDHGGGGAARPWQMGLFDDGRD